MQHQSWKYLFSGLYLKLVTVKWWPLKNSTNQAEAEQSEAQHKAKGCKEEAELNNLCVWQWFDLRSVCANDKCAKYILRKRRILFYKKKGLRHFVFAYDKEVSEYMSKILFWKKILLFDLHVSLHMSKKCQNICLRSYFEKKRSYFLNYICPNICQRNVRTYV